MNAIPPPETSPTRAGTVHRSDRVLPSFLHLLLGNGLRVLLSLGALAFIARRTALQPGVMDTFVVYLSAVGILELLAGQWLLSTILRFATEEYAESGGMRRTLAGVGLFWLGGLLLFAVPLALLGHHAARFIGVPGEPLWMLAVCGYPFLSVGRSLLPGFCQAAGRSRAFAYYPLLQPLLFVLFLLFLSPARQAAGGLSLAGIVAALVMAEALGLLALLFAVLRLAGLPRPDRAFLARMIGYGLPFALIGVSAQIVQHVDVLVLQAFQMATDRAMPYKIAYMISGYLQMIPNLSILILLPLFVERRQAGRSEGIRRYYAELVPQFLFPLGLGLGLLGTLGGPILGLFLPAFAAAEPALALLLFAVFFATLMAVDSPLFRSHDRIWGMALLTAGMALLNLGLDVLLIPRLGTTGAALATLLAFAFAAVGRLLLLSALLGYRHASYLLYALPLGGLTLLTLAVPSLAVRLPAALVLAGVSLAVARRLPLYRLSTLLAFEHARLPAPLFAGLVVCYKWLGGGER